MLGRNLGADAGARNLRALAVVGHHTQIDPPLEVWMTWTAF